MYDIRNELITDFKSQTTGHSWQRHLGFIIPVLSWRYVLVTNHLKLKKDVSGTLLFCLKSPDENTSELAQDPEKSRVQSCLCLLSYCSVMGERKPSHKVPSELESETQLQSPGPISDYILTLIMPAFAIECHSSQWDDNREVKGTERK